VLGQIRIFFMGQMIHGHVLFPESLNDLPLGRL
jgi:hypothetical protein